MDELNIRTREPGKNAPTNFGKAISMAIVAMMIAMSFTYCFTMNAKALDFVEPMAVPWTSSFTPLDSAWDSNGTQCVVVGNETNGKDPSAWLYNDPSSSWYPIYEGTDPSAKVNKRVVNENTSMIYATIQMAINNAIAGNTIRLWPGTYNEILTINKPLTLEGNGSANTIIDGRNLGTVIRVTGNGVNIYGLKVTGGSSYTGIMLYKNQNCRIENCSVEGNGDGIVISGSSYNTIKNNYVQNNAGTGIKTQNSETVKTLAGFTANGGEIGRGTMFKMDQSGSNYSVTHSFNQDYIDGYYPYRAKFIQDNWDSNYLFGVAQNGGHYSRGTIFRINKAGTSYTLLHNFTVAEGGYPQGGLVQSGGLLFGMTNNGGSANYGTIYRMNRDGTGYSFLHNFTGGADGMYPTGSLIIAGGMLYGMTPNGGTSGRGIIFRMNMDGSAYSVLLSFSDTVAPNWGAYPYGSLALDTSTGTTLYGMTNQGGHATYRSGVIFKVNLDGTGYKVLQNFTNTFAPSWGRSPSGGLTQNLNILYGFTQAGGLGYGVIFRVNTDGTGYKCMYNFTNLNGYNPCGTPIRDTFNNLYGMTYTGPAGVYGTVFSFNIGTSILNTIHTFSLASDGQYPTGSLFYDNTNLYGIVDRGGTYSQGIIFATSTSGATYNILHNFDNRPTNGVYPYGKLAQAGQFLFGATSSGGMYNDGIIFRTDLGGNGFTILRHLNYAFGDGTYPQSSPIASGGVLYGTTSNGGVGGAGVLYRMNLDGSGYAVLHDFLDNGIDGSYPYSAPLLIGSTLYGLTPNGGLSGGYGTLYRIETDGTNYNVLYNFAGYPAEPSYPRGGLVTDGTMLYGLSEGGGANDYGCVFKAAFDGSSLVPLFSFTGGGSEGRYPGGTLAFDGTNLYGITNSGGANGYGALFRTDTMGSSMTTLRGLSVADGGYATGGLTLDGNMLYGLTNSGGTYTYGTVFRMNKDTLAFNVLHHFSNTPDGANSYYSDVAVVIHPAQSSSDNLIFHNNFIGNTVQALNDDAPSNYWCDVYPIGGNYWSDYAGVDNVPAGGDGIGDTERMIPDQPLCMDSYPFMRKDGWALPYATFKSVAWDNFYHRFWICGEVSSSARSTLYFIPAVAPTTMVPIMAPPITFTTVATDEVGGVLIGANDQMAIFYYSVANDNGYSIVENGTGGMYGWNITGMTFNSLDNRFYVVGNVKNMDVGVAFVTDTLPLNQSGKKCYIDTSDFMNTPGIKGLKSISWNPVRNYGIAVGDGVYRLNPYNGNLARQLSWSTIKAPVAGTSYYDVSWDTNGWNEAGIVGKAGTFGTYWRYYYSNPLLLDGYTSITSGTSYRTCAMKPPSSPKWLLIPYNQGGIRINIAEKDESGTVSFSANKPQIFSVKVWKQSDLLQPNLLNAQVDADSTYSFLIEGNYTVGGIDMWSTLTINIAAWYDNGVIGALSQPLDPTWTNSNFRTRQFNITYNVASGSGSVVYPASIGLPPVREFYLHSSWSDPTPRGSDGYTHRVLINITFNKQTFAAAGTGFVNGPATGGAIWDKTLALNDPGSWDMQVHIFESANPSMYNITWEEFGIKQFASIASTGSPTGSAPPGTEDYYLGACTLRYSSNVAYYVTVSIPDLHMNGNPLEPKFIPATVLYVQSYHSLALGFSEMDSPIYFAGPNAPICVWGDSMAPGTPITTPIHGTESSGPLYSDYTAAAMAVPFETTSFGWWIDVPVGVSAGVYRGSITITITD